MDGGRQLRHYVVKGERVNAQRTAGFDRVEALDRLLLFLEGVTPPGRRNGELNLAKEIISRAKENGAGADFLVCRTGIPEERLRHILGGLVRRESVGHAELASIAKALGSDVESLRKIAESEEDTGMRVNRRGLNVVFAEMTRDTELYPGMHANGTSFGVGMRSLRTRLGVRRRELSAHSMQSPGLIIIGEHCILPDEALGYVSGLANTLGCSVERLCDEGAWIMRKLGVSISEEGPEELLAAVKRFVYSRLC